MFTHLFLNENTKTMRRWVVYIEAGLLVLLVAGLELLLFANLKLNPMLDQSGPDTRLNETASITWPGSLQMALQVAGPAGLGASLVMVLAVLMIAQEYTWRTLHLWLSRGVPRWQLLLAKFASLSIPTTSLVVGTLIVALVLSGFIGVALTGQAGLNQVDFGQVVWSTLRSLYSLLPYAGLAFLLAVITRSAVAALSLGLGYTLLGEALAMQVMGMLGGFWAKLALYLPGGMARSLVSLNSAIAKAPAALEAAQEGGLPPMVAVAGIALWTLLFLGLALLVFQKQDLTE